MGAHIDEQGRFQSDKYEWCLPDFVPLKVTDASAWPMLWAYAQVRRAVDAAFADDLEARLRAVGYVPPASAEQVQHPAHYQQHPSGVECWSLVEQLTFNTGNAIKYLWRQGLKGAASVDLRKATEYLRREAARSMALALVPIPAMRLADRIAAHEPEGTPLARLLHAVGQGEVERATMRAVADQIERDAADLAQELG